ncbi:MAG: hypothetical protein LBN93_10600 [Candidatus Symbiothrix sp.]|jgi:hypothetical protein|nr:hypothetical protein [Candidatus Symbiothrix sp.]
MARTVQEIKKEMTDRWMSETIIREKYELQEGASFDSAFSIVSIESILFYVFAFSIWTLEALFDYHKKEVNDLVDELKPHSLRWYVSKAKAFLLGKALVAGSDLYDTTGMTDEQIAAGKIVKYAAAVEKSAVVYLKIAKEAAGEPGTLSVDELEGFTAYVKEVKDAGVIVEIVNEPAEHFRLQMTVYYNPMVLNNTGQDFSGVYPVTDTIKRFIKELPFNGEYQNVKLVDELQKIEGVVIPELQLAETSRDGQAWEAVEAKATPYSGYYKVYDENDLILTFVPYETVSN